MTNTTTVKFNVKIQAQDKVSHTELTARELNQNERTKNAIKWLGICWGLALASVPIALAHFILVPSFFLAGIIMGMKKYREANQVQPARFPCSFCAKEISIDARPEIWPMEVTCGECRNILELTPEKQREKRREEEREEQGEKQQ